MQSNNPYTEVGAIVLAAVLIIVAGVLVYVGKINFTEATVIFGLAATIYGGNLVLKAPSPTQQAQLQTLTAKVLDVLPTVVAAVAPAQPTMTPAQTPGTKDWVMTPAQAQPPPITPSPWQVPLDTTTTTVRPPQFQSFPSRVSQDTAGFPVPQ